MVREVLTRSQLKRLSEHKYSVTGVSLLEPFMQRFWRWVVLKVPEWWAPNAMTLAGLLINIITSAMLMWYSSDGKGEVCGVIELLLLLECARDLPTRDIST